MKTTNVDNNPGPASVILMKGAKELDIACSVIMGENDVLQNPLQITNASVHTCEFDEEKEVANRVYDGKKYKVDFETMKRVRNIRIEKKRLINKDKVVSASEFEEKRLRKEGKIQDIGEYKDSKKDSDVMEIG